MTSIHTIKAFKLLVVDQSKVFLLSPFFALSFYNTAALWRLPLPLIYIQQLIMRHIQLHAPKKAVMPVKTINVPY